MINENDVQARILKAALKEFSENGFAGSRMEHIATAAQVNKAMIFYYFTSKENLYQRLIKDVFDRMSPIIIKLIVSDPSPGEFLDRIAEFYVGVYAQNPEFVRMMVLELIQNPTHLTGRVTGFFAEKYGHQGPPQLLQMIRKWYDTKLISEADPFQFMMNVVSLSLLSFIGKPFLEALFKIEPHQEDALPEFYQKRINSVTHLLKRGMLT